MRFEIIEYKVIKITKKMRLQFNLTRYVRLSYLKWLVRHDKESDISHPLSVYHLEQSHICDYENLIKVNNSQARFSLKQGSNLLDLGRCNHKCTCDWCKNWSKNEYAIFNFLGLNLKVRIKT